MAQHYSNPKRESDPYALPDLETFKVTSEDDCPLCQEGTTIGQHVMDDHNGWYWWPCFPGCLPDGEPMGPFPSETAALADARDGFDDESEDEEGD